MNQLFGLVIAGVAMFGSPGPAVLSVAATGAAFGFRAGLPYAAGIVTGTLIVAAMVLSGIAGLVLIIPGVKPVIVIAAALYILYLAYRIATAPPLGTVTRSDHTPKFVNGLALALANPKAYAGIGAVFSPHTLVAADPLWDGIAKLSLLAIIIAIIDPIWLLAGSALARLFAEPKKSRWLNITFALALLVAMLIAVPGAIGLA